MAPYLRHPALAGVPAVVDLAAMRAAIVRMTGDPASAAKVNPLVPCDLVIDHSVQVDAYDSPKALSINAMLEFQRNAERYEFLKWGQKAFSNFRVVPPATGIVHQVNLEYLAKVVWDDGTNLYPDSTVGTASNTTRSHGGASSKRLMRTGRLSVSMLAMSLSCFTNALDFLSVTSPSLPNTSKLRRKTSFISRCQLFTRPAGTTINARCPRVAIRRSPRGDSVHRGRRSGQRE